MTAPYRYLYCKIDFVSKMPIFSNLQIKPFKFAKRGGFNIISQIHFFTGKGVGVTVAPLHGENIQFVAVGCLTPTVSSLSQQCVTSVRPDWKFWPEPEPEPDCYDLAGTGTGTGTGLPS